MKANSIYCGDCIEVMGQWEENVIDLTITSPPYDNLRDYKGYKFDFENIAKQLYRVTKQGGVVVWVVGDATVKGSETGTSFRQALYFKETGFNLHDTMIYEKTNFSFPSNNRYHQIFEFMFVFSKGKPSIFNPILDKEVKYGLPWAKNTHRQKDGSTKEVKTATSYRKFGMRTNIWRINCAYGFTAKDKIAHKHPAIFPEKLAHDHIISWSNEGDIVLDPMCGSGTTLKEAIKLNRQFIGIDISEYYCAIAQERLNA